jgi:hypothetical protein
LLPVVRFGDSFDNRVAFAKKRKHIAAKEEDFGERAEEGRGAATRKSSLISVAPEGSVRK